mmetsp:Transcript_4313/g.7342  ORF Transcript_4313/g.7342 Transcript_4313/m.7342 type:complete len:208 (+) Transcript_4313:633-1256(+)
MKPTVASRRVGFVAVLLRGAVEGAREFELELEHAADLHLLAVAYGHHPVCSEFRSLPAIASQNRSCYRYGTSCFGAAACRHFYTKPSRIIQCDSDALAKEWDVHTAVILKKLVGALWSSALKPTGLVRCVVHLLLLLLRQQFAVGLNDSIVEVLHREGPVEVLCEDAVGVVLQVINMEAHGHDGLVEGIHHARKCYLRLAFRTLQKG